MANPKNDKTSGIVRLVVLVVLLLNQALVTFGYNPLPFSEEQIYEGVSIVAAVAMSIYTWWKNNNVTDKALEAQEQLEANK